MSEQEGQCGGTNSLEAVYERYKHLDCLLSDQRWLGESQKSQILYDLWRAIKYAVVNGPSPNTPSQQPPMDEAQAYKWAAQAMRGLEGVEPHRLASLADRIAAGILEAYQLGLRESCGEGD